MSTLIEAPPTPTPVPPTPGVRTAWRIVASLAAAALLFWGISETISVLAHEEHTFERTFAADDVQTIDIQIDSGSVDIVADDSVDEITVEARISDGLRATGHDERLDGTALVLRGSCPLWMSSFCSVHYDVRVPRDVAVIAELGDGHLRVDGTSGRVTASSDNGAIELFDVHGDISISSDNGSLRAEGLVAHDVTADADNGAIALGFAEPPTNVEATSDNGSVELRLPEVTGGYRVEMDTDNGSTELGVATDPGSTRRIRALSDNGDIRVLGSVGRWG